MHNEYNELNSELLYVIIKPMIAGNYSTFFTNSIKKYFKVYLFALLSLLFSLVCFFIFYCQIYSKNDYLSDLKAHVRFSIFSSESEPSGYSLLHSLVNFFAKTVSSFAFIDLQSAANLGMVIMLTIAIYLTALLIKNYFDGAPDTFNFRTIILTFSTLIVSMIITTLPGTGKFVYLGVGTPNPWHNPTYLICRPFSILVFLLFLEVFRQAQENKTNYLHYIGLALFAIISMWFKPSFMMSFLPATALIVLYYWFKHKIGAPVVLRLLFTFLPSVIIIVLVYKFVYQGQSKSSISFVTGDFWYLYTKSVLLSILLGMLFPVYVFVLKIKDLSFEFKVAALNYIIALLIAFFVAETGDRAAHGNMFWTYMFAMFFMFLVATKTFFLESKLYLWQRILGNLFYAAHIISGIIYFVNVFKGKSYF